MTYIKLNKLSNNELKQFANLENITDKQYQEITEQAQEYFYTMRTITNAKNGDFLQHYVFISTNNLHGFYFPNMREYNGVKLECIAFKTYYKYVGGKFEKDGSFKPVAIFINNYGEYFNAQLKELDISFYIEQEINKYKHFINEYRNDIQALKAIEIITKKNGEPFAVFGSNFKNATAIYDGGDGYKKLYIPSRQITINCYDYADTDQEQHNAIATGHELHDNGTRRTTYTLTFEEIKQAINNEIDWRQNAINQRLDKIKNIEKDLVPVFKYLTRELCKFECKYSSYAYRDSIVNIMTNFYI